MGQPNGGTGENCAAIDGNGNLQDVNCNTPNLYICEKEELSYSSGYYPWDGSKANILSNKYWCQKEKIFLSYYIVYQITDKYNITYY